MRLPLLVYVLGYSGLIPFIAAPLWLTLSPATAPHELDQIWLSYTAMIACFMAGSFWGMALIVSEGPSGLIGLVMSAVMMLLAFGASLLPFHSGLLGLGAVFLLLALAEIWRERTLDPMSGYFTMRIVLTVGVVVTIAWRLALPIPG